MSCTGKESLFAYLYYAFFIFISAFNAIMSSVLGFGEKCTCWFNVPLLSLTLTVWLLWVVLLFEKKSMKAFGMKTIWDRTRRRDTPDGNKTPWGGGVYESSLMCGTRLDGSVNKTVQKFLWHAVGAVRFSNWLFGVGLSGVWNISMLHIWSNSWQSGQPGISAVILRN